MKKLKVTLHEDEGKKVTFVVYLEQILGDIFPITDKNKSHTFAQRPDYRKNK